MEATTAYTTRFGEDCGTVHFSESAEPLDDMCGRKWNWWTARRLRKQIRFRPVVWFVDDEIANRDWFAKAHGERFGVVTFSDPKYATRAMEAMAPCDAIVTDIFFPATPPASQADEDALLSIYDVLEDEDATQRDLKNLWANKPTREKWSLKGFQLACDVTEIAQRRKERIPVLLFSRKAPMLLSADDWSQGVPHTVEDTFWMLEKVKPDATGLDFDKVAMVQAVRIRAALRYRLAATPRWKRLIRGIKVELGPVAVSHQITA